MSGRLSRRDFGKRTVLSAAAAAAAALLPAAVRADPPAAGAPSGPKLSAPSRAEAEARLAEILARRGARLGAAERAEVKKAVWKLQEALDELRAFPLGNADEPALGLHLRARGKPR